MRTYKTFDDWVSEEDFHNLVCDQLFEAGFPDSWIKHIADNGKRVRRDIRRAWKAQLNKAVVGGRESEVTCK